MATKEELFAAARLIKGYCESRDSCQISPKDYCPFFIQVGSTWCMLNNHAPCKWPVSKKGGGEDD